MLEQLHVRNFRGFKDLRIDSLHRINLIAGRNDTGKSTLLEAIFLLASAANPPLAVNVHVVRSEGVTVAGAGVRGGNHLEAAFLRTEHG